MVRKCCVCEKYSPRRAGLLGFARVYPTNSFSRENLSFHRFPADPSTRKIWLSLVGLDDCSLPKTAMICSEHFEPFDMYESRGKKFIKIGCLPKPVDPLLVRNSFHGSDSTLSVSTDTSPAEPNILPQEPVTSSVKSFEEFWDAQEPLSKEDASNSSACLYRETPAGSFMRFHSTPEENLQLDSKFYKQCIVPQCTSTSKLTPNKLFIPAPDDEEIRADWLTLAGLDPNYLLRDPEIYFCEEHFNLPNDVENYREYVMGLVSEIRLKPDSFPWKFACQMVEGKKIRSCRSSRSSNARRDIAGQFSSVQELEQLSKPHCEPYHDPNVASTSQVHMVEKNHCDISPQQIIKSNVDDLLPSDFSTPDRRRIHVRLIRGTFRIQATRISRLKTAISKLRHKISSMEKSLEGQ